MVSEMVSSGAVNVEELRTAIEQQAALMVTVATGGPRIEDRNAEYRTRRRNILAELRDRGLADPNPYADLWAWHGHWSQHLGTWASRRAYISELYQPLLDALDHLEERPLGAGLQDALTGWERVDDQLAQLRERFARAETAEDFQAVGLLCRDIFRSLSDATFDEDEHLPEGEALPGPADAKKRLGFTADAVAAGGSNRELRALLKASFDLANKVQHARAATLDEAALVAEATVASVNLMRVLMLGAAPLDEEDEQPAAGIL
jgi:hypothetical protein